MFNIKKKEKEVRFFYKNHLLFTFNQRSFTHILVGVILILIGFIGYRMNQNFKEESFGIEKDHELLLYFEEKFPEVEVLKAGEEDVTANGKKDLIVIYRKLEEDYNEMRGVLRLENRIYITDPIDAPYENLTLEFIDIDGKDPLEFIVSGSRRGHYGYSIIRVDEGLALYNVFSEGMEKC